MKTPPAMERVIHALSRLPGIGPKSAVRLAFFLLKSTPAEVREFSEALRDLQANVHFCPECHGLSGQADAPCEICADPRRDRSQLAVVGRPLDMLSIERAGVYRGRYHCLHGLLSPVDGVGPEDIKIAELLARIRSGGIREVILATNPSMEGDATSLYIARILSGQDVMVTRLARGLSAGADLEFTDSATLSRALSDRSRV